MQQVKNAESSDLEGLVRQRLEAEEIALRLFRFKGRRGLGVLYSAATMLLLIEIITFELAGSALLVIPEILVGVVAVWYATAKSGFSGLARANESIRLLKGEVNAKERVLLGILVRIVALNILWVIYNSLVITGYTQFAFVFPVGYAVASTAIFLSRYANKTDIIINWRVEDWVFQFMVAAASIAVLVPWINVLGFVLATPVLIWTGMKSLYDAPKEMLSQFDHEGVEHEESIPKETVQKLTSLGPLSNSARVGILIILMGPRKATFTDLLLASKLPKSSLNASLGMLQEAGYVSTQISFVKNGRPRTIIEITEEGEKAVREYASYMSRLTSSVLAR